MTGPWSWGMAPCGGAVVILAGGGAAAEGDFIAVAIELEFGETVLVHEFDDLFDLFIFQGAAC